MKTVALDTLRGFRFLAQVVGFLIPVLVVGAGAIVVIGALFSSLSAGVVTGAIIIGTIVVSAVTLSALVGARLRSEEASLTRSSD